MTLDRPIAARELANEVLALAHDINDKSLSMGMYGPIPCDNAFMWAHRAHIIGLKLLGELLSENFI